MNHFNPSLLVRTALLNSRSLALSNIVQLLVVFQSCFFLVNKSCIWIKNWVVLSNKNSLEDIYKRERCLLVASVHDLVAKRWFYLAKCCLMSFLSLLNAVLCFSFWSHLVCANKPLWICLIKLMKLLIKQYTQITSSRWKCFSRASELFNGINSITVFSSHILGKPVSCLRFENCAFYFLILFTCVNNSHG